MSKLQNIEIYLPELKDNININFECTMYSIDMALKDKNYLSKNSHLHNDKLVAWNNTSLAIHDYPNFKWLQININEKSKSNECVYITYDNQRMDILDFIRLYISCHHIEKELTGWTTVVYGFDNIENMVIKYVEEDHTFFDCDAKFCIMIYLKLR